MKRLLITGASGFIGSTLAEAALAKGWSVTAAIRASSSLKYLRDPRLETIVLPYEQETLLQNTLQQAGRFDYIVHGAGTTKALRRADYFRINTIYTQNLVAALHTDQLRPEKFLFLSSLAALGPANERPAVHPQQYPRPVTSYGASKRAAEEHLEQLNGFPWVALQPTAVFGPRDTDIWSFIQLVHRGLELHIGAVPQRVSFIYIKDLIALMLAALEKGPAGRRYIVSDSRDYTTDDLGLAVKTALDRPALRLRLPLGLVRVIAAASEFVGRLRGQMPPLNREKLHEIGGASWWCDPSQTLDELQFSPQYDLFSGMEEAVDWYRKEGWL